MSEGVTDHTGFIEKYYMNPDAGKASEKESANDDQKKDDSESDGLQKKEDKSEKNSSEWKAAYTDIVNEFESKSNEYGDDFERQYDLVYIDDDDIPELICTFNSTSEMSSFYSGELYTCIDGKVVMLSDAIYGPSGAGGNNFDTLFFERRNVILKESVSEAGASFYSVISQINIQNKNLDTIELCSAAYDKEKYSSTIDAGQDIANEHKFFFKDGKRVGDLSLTYSMKDNRSQSVDANQLLQGVEQNGDAHPEHHPDVLLRLVQDQLRLGVADQH